MTPAAKGAASPHFTVESTGGSITVPDPAGRPTLVMFFQEAGTPTCSQQVATVDAEHELLDQLGARAVCLSTDPPERQVEFAAALGGSRHSVRALRARGPGRRSAARGHRGSGAASAGRSVCICDQMPHARPPC